ncbi:MAG: transposase [Candidatus Omnitrophota bacterium]|nr:transposase [Candidatus Omnitrophota bacterium]
MKEFNTPGHVINLRRSMSEVSPHSKEPKEKLVEVVCYSLMPNHFHFILRQLIDKGISKFMQKLGTGYTGYFNTKYERSGALFQGVFKDAHIDNDAYLLHLSRYIHLNCLGIIYSNWKKEGIKNKKEALEFLKTYKWSSFPFYLDREKPCLIKLAPEIVINQFDSIEDYEKFVISWTEKELETVSDLILE